MKLRWRYHFSILFFWFMTFHLPKTNAQSSQEIGPGILLIWMASSNQLSSLFQIKSQELSSRCSENIAELQYQEKWAHEDNYGIIGQSVYFADGAGLLTWEPDLVNEQLKPDYLSIKSANAPAVQSRSFQENHDEPGRCPSVDKPFFFLIISDKNGYLLLVIFSVNGQGQMVDTSLPLNIHLSDPLAELFLMELTKYSNVVLNLGNWPVLIDRGGEMNSTFFFGIAPEEDDSPLISTQNSVDYARQVFGVIRNGHFFASSTVPTGRQLMDPGKGGGNTFPYSRSSWCEEKITESRKQEAAGEKAKARVFSLTIKGEVKKFTEFTPQVFWEGQRAITEKKSNPAKSQDLPSESQSASPRGMPASAKKYTEQEIDTALATRTASSTSHPKPSAAPQSALPKIEAPKRALSKQIQKRQRKRQNKKKKAEKEQELLDIIDSKEGAHKNIFTQLIKLWKEHGKPVGEIISMIGEWLDYENIDEYLAAELTALATE